jgi:hypothetical protein
MSLIAIATAAPPAGGAAIGQVVGATAAALVLTALLLHFGLGHRSGRVKALGRLARVVEARSGIPAWAALPSMLAAVSLLTAVFGAYWDISLHIDNGRDPGPLANPAHYFILGGLFGIFAAGWLAVVLPEEKPGPAAVRIGVNWWTPASGLLLIACSGFSMIGFPLDDVSHRLYGQDVTLWGPTHLMLIGGAVMTLVGILGLLAEGKLAGRIRRGRPGAAPASSPRLVPSPRGRSIQACGGLLIGLTLFQGEFQYGVPQFSLLYHPLLMALAGSLPLVAARAMAGRGAALRATAFYLLVLGVISLIVGPVLGETTLHFPLFIVEAAMVEAVALALEPGRRPIAFAGLAGALVGSVGVLAEWGWSHVWMPIPWPAQIVPEAVVLGVVVATAGAGLGLFVARALLFDRAVLTRRASFAALGCLLAIAGAVAYLLPLHGPDGVRASVKLSEVRPAPHREVMATVRYEPATAADGAYWLRSISWQGHDKLRGAPLRRIGEGIYRTTEPIPAYGSWKSAIRLHRGRLMSTLPIYAPADPAIPVPAISAPSSFQRPLIDERQFLQRERRRDVPAWLFGVAGLVVLACFSVLLAIIAWGLARICRSAPGVESPPAREAGQGAGTPPRRAVPAGVS